MYLSVHRIKNTREKPQNMQVYMQFKKETFCGKNRCSQVFSLFPNFFFLLTFPRQMVTSGAQGKTWSRS